MLTEKQCPCVGWDGRTNYQGYPVQARSLRTLSPGTGHDVYVCREMWISEHGVIPNGFEIHHKCGNRSCVEIEHLAAIPRREHRLLHGQHKVAAARRGAQMKAVTHCIHGHEFTPENTYRCREGWRSCLKCRRDAEARRQERRRNAH